MLAYLRKRILSSALPLVAVIVGVFALARLTGNPANLYLPLNATDQMRADFTARHGLDQPLLTQMADYFGGVLRMDFGESLGRESPRQPWRCGLSRPPCSWQLPPWCWPSSWR